MTWWSAAVGEGEGDVSFAYAFTPAHAGGGLGPPAREQQRPDWLTTVNLTTRVPVLLRRIRVRSCVADDGIAEFKPNCGRDRTEMVGRYIHAGYDA